MSKFKGYNVPDLDEMYIANGTIANSPLIIKAYYYCLMSKCNGGFNGCKDCLFGKVSNLETKPEFKEWHENREAKKRTQNELHNIASGKGA